MPSRIKKVSQHTVKSDWQRRQRIALNRVSWSRSFAQAVTRRMNIEALIRDGNYHGAAFMLYGTGKGVLVPKTVTQRQRLEREVKKGITGHAPWLNGDGISHRRAVGAQEINGFYYN